MGVFLAVFIAMVVHVLPCVHVFIGTVPMCVRVYIYLHACLVYQTLHI